MGKSNYKKSKSKSLSESGKCLSHQKRNEVNEVVKKLLKLSSQILATPKLEWELYLEISKLLTKVQDIEPVFDEERKREEYFPKLMSWMKENGGIIDNVKIRKFEKMDYGLEAARDLKEGELICSVPRKLMMTLENVKDSPLAHLYFNDPILKNMGNIALALFLILEYLKGPESFWYPYIASLPVNYNTVLYFDSQDFAELKSSPAFEVGIKHCKNIARQYSYFYKVFHTSNDQASLILRNSFTYQLYRWAVSTVMTRQNIIPSEHEDQGVNALIPLWDMGNHTDGYLSTRCGPSGTECTACRPFPQGHQILMFYGKRSNADFLVHNGFVYEGNEYDSYRLRLGVSKADKLHDLRSDLLSSLGIPPTTDYYIYSGSEPIKAQLLAFLRIFNMEKEHLEHWKNSTRQSDLLEKDCALDTQIECKVWKFLSNRIKLLLSTYGEEAEETTDNISESRRMVRKQLFIERKFLKTVLEYVEQRIKL